MTVAGDQSDQSDQTVQALPSCSCLLPHVAIRRLSALIVHISAVLCLALFHVSCSTPTIGAPLGSVRSSGPRHSPALTVATEATLPSFASERARAHTHKTTQDHTRRRIYPNPQRPLHNSSLSAPGTRTTPAPSLPRSLAPSTGPFTGLDSIRQAQTALVCHGAANRARLLRRSPFRAKDPGWLNASAQDCERAASGAR